MRVCDAHVHFFSHKFFSMLGAQAGRSVDEVIDALEWQKPDSEPAAFAQTWSAELDKNNVARAALIASLPCDEPPCRRARCARPLRLLHRQPAGA